MNKQCIEDIADKFWAYGRDNNWQALVNLFSEDATFINPLFSAAITGHKALTDLFSSMNDIHNIREWTVIDGHRLVIGWRERKEDGVETRPWYRGISSFVINDDGLIQTYEAFFDAKACLDSFNYREN